MNPTQERKDEIVEGLRKMASFIEASDLQLPLPHNMDLPIYSGSVTDPRGIMHSMDSKVGMALIANMAGSVDKEVDVSFFKLVKDFGGGVKLSWTAYRETVCERVVVGTKVVPAEPERLVAAVPERTEEVIEWKCPSLLKAGASVMMPNTPEIEAPRQSQLPEAVDDMPF